MSRLLGNFLLQIIVLPIATTTAFTTTVPLSPMFSRASPFHLASEKAAMEVATEAETVTEATVTIGPTGIRDPSTIPLLQQRLMDAGVPLEEMSLVGDQTEEQQDEQHTATEGKSAEDNIHIVNIKTLVWQVQVTSASGTTTATTPLPQLDDTNDTQPYYYYVVAALPIQETVDVPRLGNLVAKHLRYSHQVEFLSMAPREVAESLTGFTSGCMPPIGHTTTKHLPLFVDSSMIQARDEQPSNQVVMASIGSGIPGKSLLLPLQQLLQVAAKTGGVRVGSFLSSSSPPLLQVPIEKTPQERRQERKQERVSRQPKPKDRLQEYRKLHDRVDRAKLLRTTARKKGRFHDVQTLVDEAVRTGDFPHLFDIQPEEGFSKNALHMCAWRGDLEAVQLLVETAQQQYNVDIVNLISKGPGNYGKTPIFYALTQCREDVVRYLIDRGNASLLIVNNKGQTPCSIAVSHLSKEACDYMFQVERQQLEQGMVFSDYRQSHSDEKLYGDLDPRFPIDNYNYGDDLVESLQQYRDSTSSVINGIPTQFEPRSLRPTVRWWNREDGSLANANSAHPEGPLTFTQPRQSTPPKTAKKKQGDNTQPNRDDIAKAIDINSLELLTIQLVLDRDSSSTPYPDETPSSVLLVNSSETLRQLEADIDAAIENAGDNQNEENKTVDNILLNSTWGLDCEWKPGLEHGKDNPVSLLQLSSRHRSYIVDLQSLCQVSHHLVDGAGWTQVNATPMEMQLDRALSKLFHNHNLPLLGFGIHQDLGKMAMSFPHLPCFAKFTAVIDLQTVATAIYSKGARNTMSSLQKMVATLLAKRLDKSKQCSDWTQRPLSATQISYAALDAAVLPILLETMMEKSVSVEPYNGQFFAVHANLRSNLQYTFLDKSVPDEIARNGEDWVWHVPMGSLRHTLVPGRYMARQCWPLLGDTPEPPRPATMEVDCSSARKGNKENSKLGSNGRRKPKPIQLSSLAGNLDNLPIPGTTLGYTKDSCVSRVVGHMFINTLPDGTTIGYNRRSGVVEMNNAWILFCNFGGNVTKSNYYLSDFSKHGRHLRFNVNPERQNGKSSERTLMNYIARGSNRATSKQLQDNKTILLFARDGTSSKYMYCGSCRCIDYTVQEENVSVDLHLELENYEELVGDKNISSSFIELVKWREQVSCKHQQQVS
ncbi:Ankyrin repeat [Seminavis robusta]|uniref:Ankyrin repeat n=1 Tax=Seminavis robusta TaxID=568900 RepID=A0A9N8EIE7_9STRA|nr:Ankyrin repeat [Seminavis robusta]|eukprot:Sro1277_g258690.1 Ankyrin repeat (1163) ;mRNA; r:16225-19713